MSDIGNELVNRISNDFNNKFEELIKEALKIKGFDFKTKIELAQFIKDCCRCDDFVDVKERVYYFENTPFLLHKYSNETIKMPINNNGDFTLNADYGSFSFL